MGKQLAQCCAAVALGLLLMLWRKKVASKLRHGGGRLCCPGRKEASQVRGCVCAEPKGRGSQAPGQGLTRLWLSMVFSAGEGGVQTGVVGSWRLPGAGLMGRVGVSTLASELPREGRSHLRSGDLGKCGRMLMSPATELGTLGGRGFVGQGQGPGRWQGAQQEELREAICSH